MKATHSAHINQVKNMLRRLNVYQVSMNGRMSMILLLRQLIYFRCNTVDALVCGHQICIPLG